MTFRSNPLRLLICALSILAVHAQAQSLPKKEIHVQVTRCEQVAAAVAPDVSRASVMDFVGAARLNLEEMGTQSVTKVEKTLRIQLKATAFHATSLNEDRVSANVRIESLDGKKLADLMVNTSADGAAISGTGECETPADVGTLKVSLSIK